MANNDGGLATTGEYIYQKENRDKYKDHNVWNHEPTIYSNKTTDNTGEKA